ncbi:MAG: Mur ligase family protein [Candidatus Actinomarina sp.]|nr:Mur ligase family protein [Actinomycetota bacterium]
MDFKTYFDLKINQSKNKNTNKLKQFFINSEMEILRNKTISIVGTNGKTSTANIIYNYLNKKNIKTTKFISPHLVDIEERIESSSQLNYLEAFKQVKKFEKELGLNLGYFESLFLIACKVFLLNNDDYFICEAGIGGKLDTTSIIQSNTVVLTNIGFDHQELLGNSKLEILDQKVNISQNIKNLFIGELDKSLISNIKSLNNSIERIYFSKDSSLNFDLNFDELSYVQKNAILAFLVLDKLIDFKNTFSIENETFQQPGRFETVSIKPLKIIDGSHNISGLEAAIRDYQKKYLNDPIDVFVGFKKGKNYKEMLMLISKYSFFNIFVINDDEFYQQEKVENLTDYLDLIKKNYAVVPLDYFDNNMNSSILIGSLYLIGEYKKRNKL